jgi:hypothetical protein
MIMSVDQSMEWKLAGEAEVLREKPAPSATLSTNPTWRDLVSNPGRRVETVCYSVGRTQDSKGLESLTKDIV